MPVKYDCVQEVTLEGRMFFDSLKMVDTEGRVINVEDTLYRLCSGKDIKITITINKPLE